MAELHPMFLLEGETPRLIDGWQLASQIWLLLILARDELGGKEIEEAAKNLLTLQKKINTDKMKKPSFMMILTGTKYGYRREDGIYIVPCGCLDL